MVSYLLKILFLVVFSFIVISFYYAKGSGHLESFATYTAYVLPVLFVYGIYKFYQIDKSPSKLVIGLPAVVGFFLAHLFLLSTLFFHYNGLPLSGGLLLFIKILGFILIPLFIIFTSIGFGKKIYNKIFIECGKDKNELFINNSTFSFLASLGIGFFSFVTLLMILGVFGLYNIYSVTAILILFVASSYKEIIELFYGFLDYKIEIEGHDLKSDNFIKNIGLKLLSTEFLFIVATLIISINFINIMRPMPIGWDDLGAYMNFPRQMAYAGGIESLGGMYSWQVFTGIGFMIGEPVQAFFINNVGGILSFIVLVLVLGDLIGSKSKTFINIPLLLATFYISMPMVVFQQAKDMKIDQGLFFVSVIVIYLVYKFFSYKFNEQKIKKHDAFKGDTTIKLLIFVGLLAGFAFSLKFTSLLLISSIIGVLFYIGYGIFGFLGFVGIFFAVFTKLGLWSYMNVVYPDSNQFLINTFSALSFIGGIISLIIGFSAKKFKNVDKFIVSILIFIVSIGAGVSPWLIKNVSEADSINFGTILNGQVDRFDVDYTKIYSDDEISDIQEKVILGRGITGSGTTTNEDFGRYFGYEKGINNYVKLPWNLSLQLNQGGEFTTISYIFLALLPILFLFLPYKKRYISLFILSLILLELLVFILPGTRDLFTAVFAGITLPFGYIVLFLLGLAPLGVLLFILKNSKLMYIFKINLVFLFFYIFLWAISAFGIVWYGIVMYFSMLLSMGIAIYYLSKYKDEEDNKGSYDKEVIFKFFGSIILLGVFLVWFLMSTLPYSFNNLKSAGYKYTKGYVDQGKRPFTNKELVFAYHKDYIKILFSLNIDKEKRNQFLDSIVTSEQLRPVLRNYYTDIASFEAILKLLEQGDFVRVFGKDFSDKISSDVKRTLSFESREIRLNLYAGLLKPEEEFKGESGVYRIGTFLKYYIDGNMTRLMEDNLIDRFNNYIYDKNPDISVERMKKLGLGYLLVDLNAATIDQDPRHELTKRYEGLLSTFRSDALELVETDSVCLKLALENYHKSEKTNKDYSEYLFTAGVNYESYKDDGTQILRGKKKVFCFDKIIEVVDGGLVKDNDYKYLKNIANTMNKKSDELNNRETKLLFLNKVVHHGSKVLFEIK